MTEKNNTYSTKHSNHTSPTNLKGAVNYDRNCQDNQKFSVGNCYLKEENEIEYTVSAQNNNLSNNNILQNSSQNNLINYKDSSSLDDYNYAETTPNIFNLEDYFKA